MSERTLLDVIRDAAAPYEGLSAAALRRIAEAVQEAGYRRTVRVDTQEQLCCYVGGTEFADANGRFIGELTDGSDDVFRALDRSYCHVGWETTRDVEDLHYPVYVTYDPSRPDEL
jgi:hypothetical protein